MKLKIFFVFVAVCTLLFTTSIAFGYKATFKPRISVIEKYTDNYFLEDTNKDDELITLISPSFDAQILGKNSGANIYYNPEYSLHDEFEENDSWRHFARFRGWADLSKNTRLNFRDRFRLTEDPLSEADIAVLRAEEPEVIVDPTIRKNRRTYYTNTAGVNLLHQFGELDSFDLGYNHYILENDDPSFENKVRHRPYFEATYWFVQNWGVNLRGDYTIGENDLSDDYDQIDARARLIRRFTRLINGFVQFGYTTLDYDGTSEDAESYSASAGFDYAIAADISMSLSAGYTLLSREISDDESSMNADVILTKTLSRGVIYLSGSGGFKGPNFGAETLGISEFYEAATSIKYQLAKHLSGNAFGSYRYDKYLEQINEREDKTTKAGLGLEWQALKWMSIGLNYQFRSFDTTIDVDDYDENRGFVKVTLSPPVPYRTSRY